MLRKIGRELASAIVKGSYEAPKPTDLVPLSQLRHVCENHGLAALSAAEFTCIAKTMRETLEEADRWTLTTHSSGPKQL